MALEGAGLWGREDCRPEELVVLRCKYVLSGRRRLVSRGDVVAWYARGSPGTCASAKSLQLCPTGECILSVSTIASALGGFYRPLNS